MAARPITQALKHPITQSPTRPMLCTCCTPPAPLVPVLDESAEPRWACATSTHPYAVRSGVLVGLPYAPWDDTTAGATPMQTVQIDLSREGYS
jgi:hypothetical protein